MNRSQALQRLIKHRDYLEIEQAAGCDYSDLIEAINLVVRQNKPTRCKECNYLSRRTCTIVGKAVAINEPFNSCRIRDDFERNKNIKGDKQ